jgi:hypothetical protein
MIRDEAREQIFDPTLETVTEEAKILPDPGVLLSCRISASPLI